MILQEQGLCDSLSWDWQHWLKFIGTHCHMDECKNAFLHDPIKVGQRKYSMGRQIKGNWVLGSVERGSNLSLYIPVKDRSRRTLIRMTVGVAGNHHNY